VLRVLLQSGLKCGFWSVCICSNRHFWLIKWATWWYPDNYFSLPIAVGRYEGLHFSKLFCSLHWIPKTIGCIKCSCFDVYVITCVITDCVQNMNTACIYKYKYVSRYVLLTFRCDWHHYMDGKLNRFTNVCQWHALHNVNEVGIRGSLYDFFACRVFCVILVWIGSDIFQSCYITTNLWTNFAHSGPGFVGLFLFSFSIIYHFCYVHWLTLDIYL